MKISAANQRALECFDFAKSKVPALIDEDRRREGIALAAKPPVKRHMADGIALHYLTRSQVKLAFRVQCNLSHVLLPSGSDGANMPNYLQNVFVSYSGVLSHNQPVTQAGAYRAGRMQPRICRGPFAVACYLA